MHPESILLIPALLVLHPGRPPANPAPAAKAAIVCKVEGKPTVQDSAKGKRDVALFDWLPAGARLQTGAGTRLVLVFANGARFALDENSSARVGPTGLEAAKGQVRKLDPAPMIPTMAQTAVAEARGKPGGITVRNARDRESWFTEVLPEDGGAVLADEAMLSFKPGDPGGRYQVQVIDAVEDVLFTGETEAEHLSLAPGVLKPGAWYNWRVTLVNPRRGKPMESTFRTVDELYAGIRTRLKADAERSGDPELKALLEAMDRWLGLKR
jgi:hypothetical protein